MNEQIKALDTMPVRAGEELDLEILADFLRKNLQNLPEGKLEVRQFTAGHSNLTYQVMIGEWEAVLRKQPLGPVAPKAHDMEREYRILAELSPIFSQAPRPILFSKDIEIVGSPFFLMERKRGFVFDTSIPSGITPTRELFRNLSQQMVENLVKLHALPYQETGLALISKPEGFMERQVHGWIARYERAKTHEVPEAKPLQKWLIEHIPTHSSASVIHYDYKLNNAMFDASGDEMIGLFDWEMATVGDPLADLGVAMSYWIQQADSDVLKYGLGKPPVTILDGFYTRDDFIAEYARLSGRDVSEMNFYLTFGFYKLAGICQQIYYRYLKGQTKDERFSQFDIFVKTLIEHAYSLTKE